LNIRWTNSLEKPSLKKKPVIDRGLLVRDEGHELAEIPSLLVYYHLIPRDILMSFF